MSEQRTLYDVKTALADKYERLARLSGSKPKQKACMYRAVKYRRQAIQIARGKK